MKKRLRETNEPGTNKCADLYRKTIVSIAANDDSFVATTHFNVYSIRDFDKAST